MSRLTSGQSKILAGLKQLKAEALTPDPEPITKPMEPKVSRIQIANLSQDELEKLAKEITGFFSKNSINVDLNQSKTLTVKTRQSGFRKVPHVGGEKFALTGAYAGKRDGIIMIARPFTPTEYLQAEIPLEDGVKLFDTFPVIEELIMNYGQVSQILSSGSAPVKTEPKRSPAEVLAHNMAIPGYGTW